MEPSFNEDKIYYNLSKIDTFVEKTQKAGGGVRSLRLHDDGRLYTYGGISIGQSAEEFDRVVDQIEEVAKGLKELSQEKITPRLELKNELLIIAERYGASKYEAQAQRLKDIATNLVPEDVAIEVEIEGEEAVIIPEETFLRIRNRLSLSSNKAITMELLKELDARPEKLNDTHLQKQVHEIVTTFGHRVNEKAKIYGGKASNWGAGKVKKIIQKKFFEILYDPIGQAVEPSLRATVSTLTSPISYVPYAGNWMQKTIEDIAVNSFKKPVKKVAKIAPNILGGVAEELCIKGFEDAKQSHEAKQASKEAIATAERLVKEGSIGTYVETFKNSADFISELGTEQIESYRQALHEIAKELLSKEVNLFIKNEIDIPVASILRDLEVIETYAANIGATNGISLNEKGHLKQTSRGLFQSAQDYEKTINHIQKLVRNIQKMYENASDKSEKLLSLKYQLLTISEAYSSEAYKLPNGMLKELAESLVPVEVEREASRDILELPEQLLFQIRANLRSSIEITPEKLKELDEDPTILNDPELQKKIHEIVSSFGTKLKDKTKIFGTKTAQWGWKQAKSIAVKEATNMIYDPLGRLVAPTVVWGVQSAATPIKSVPVLGPIAHNKLGEITEKQLKKMTKKVTKKAINKTEEGVKRKVKKNDTKKELSTPTNRWKAMIERDEKLFEQERVTKDLIDEFEKMSTRLFLQDPRVAKAFADLSTDFAHEMIRRASEEEMLQA